MSEPMIIAEPECEEISRTGQCIFKSFSNKLPIYSNLLLNCRTNRQSFKRTQTNRYVESESSECSNGNNLEVSKQFPKEINSVADYFDPFSRLRPPVFNLNSFSSVSNAKRVYQTKKELEFDELELEQKELCPEQKELCPERKELLCPEQKDLCPDQKDLRPDKKELCPEQKELCPQFSSEEEVKLEINENIPMEFSSEENITAELLTESSKLVDKVILLFIIILNTKVNPNYLMKSLFIFTSKAIEEFYFTGFFFFFCI